MWLLTRVITLLSQYVNELLGSCMNEQVREWTNISNRVS